MNKSKTHLVGGKTELAALLEQPRENASKYTAASYSTYMQAIENAQLIMVDPEASDEDIKSALDTLKAAIEALVEVGDDTMSNAGSDTQEDPNKKGGCGSVLSGTAMVLSIMGLFAFAVRRKEND